MHITHLQYKVLKEAVVTLRERLEKYDRGVKELPLMREASDVLTDMDKRANPSKIINGKLVLDLKMREFFKDGQAVDMRPKELDLLIFMMENVGRVLTLKEILQAVWGPGYGDTTAYGQYVRVSIGNIREKLGIETAIQSRKGEGYFMEREQEYYVQYD